MKKKAKKPTKRTLRRDAKTGRMVTKADAKKRPAETVAERVDEVLWRGWTIVHANGSFADIDDGPLLYEKHENADFDAFHHRGETAVRVKLVRDSR